VFVANGDSDPMILPTTRTCSRAWSRRPGEDLPRRRCRGIPRRAGL